MDWKTVLNLAWTWIQGKYQWIIGVALGIIALLAVRTYYNSVYKSDFLALQLKDVEKILKEHKRVAKLKSEAEAKIPEDKPTPVDGSGQTPGSFTLVFLLVFLLSSCATTRPCAPDKIDLPVLKTYTAGHQAVKFDICGEKYCTEKTSYDKLIYNEAEYKRVIKNYTEEIGVYNQFKTAYENDAETIEPKAP